MTGEWGDERKMDDPLAERLVKVGPARIVPAQAEEPITPDLTVPLPPEIAALKEGSHYSVVPSEYMHPMAEFENPGEYLLGRFDSARANVGPNKSWVYLFVVDNKENGKRELVGVWGSNALDAKMARANPNKGQSVCIQYLGTAPTSRNQNPVKLFRVITSKSAG